MLPIVRFDSSCLRLWSLCFTCFRNLSAVAYGSVCKNCLCALSEHRFVARRFLNVLVCSVRRPVLFQVRDADTNKLLGECTKTLRELYKAAAKDQSVPLAAPKKKHKEPRGFLKFEKPRVFSRLEDLNLLMKHAGVMDEAKRRVSLGQV